MKHANGTEYALWPKVATDIATFKARFRKLIPMDCGRPWDDEAYAFWGWDELRRQLQSPVAYEPSEEDVERVRLALENNLSIRVRGPGNFEVLYSVTAESARAAIRAFIGGME